MDIPEAPELRPDLPKRTGSRESGRSDEYRRMGIAYSVPAALTAPVVVLTLGGAWLDARMGWTPAATVIGALLGSVTGLMNMIRLASRLDK